MNGTRTVINNGVEAEPTSFGGANARTGHRSNLAGQTDLTEGGHCMGHGAVVKSASDGNRDGEVGTRFGESNATNGRHVDVFIAQGEPRAPLENGENHGHAR